MKKLKKLKIFLQPFVIGVAQFDAIFPYFAKLVDKKAKLFF